jgi:NAD(P)-dependent dehydrogenase (short-subunit alcohol dehydrogenase family)
MTQPTRTELTPPFPVPSFRLDGKTAIVTGASRGIGEAIALALAHAGARVTLASRDEARLGKVAEQIRGIGAQALPSRPTYASQTTSTTLSRAPTRSLAA